MYEILCPVCRSSKVMKNGKRNGVQLYICGHCRHQFRNLKVISKDNLWEMYSAGKQTVLEIAESVGVSESTIKRQLCTIVKEWKQPPLSGEGYVHIDATYWGRNWGVLAAIDSASGRPLYLAFISHERASDYLEAIRSIEERGYTINGIILDGIRPLFTELDGRYNLQMCQFHMKQIIRRYLTLRPKLLAAREMNRLIGEIVNYKKDDFERQYADWKNRWKDTLNRRSTSSVTGRQRYTHRKLRTAMHSIDFFLPYLFTYQHSKCAGMPNTNNRIEGTFTDLKKNLNNHSGMTKESRKRFISGFFLDRLDSSDANE